MVGGAASVMGLAIEPLHPQVEQSFNLFCDVAGGDSTPRKIPGTHKFGDITLKRGVLSLDRHTFAYSLYSAPTGEDVDVFVAYVEDRQADRLPSEVQSDCPPVEIEVVVLDPLTLESLDSVASAVIAPGESISHTLGIPHEHQPPTASPVTPLLVATRLAAASAVGPHCSLVPVAEATGSGITSDLDVWVWRKSVETGD